MNNDLPEFDGPVEATISGIHAAYARGALTTRALTQMYLDRIAAYDQKGPMLNAIITVNPAALERADSLDRDYQASGLVGPLHGIPIIVKDNLNTNDMPTTGGCDALRHSIPPENAFVVNRLLDAGAIILAKSSMSEFAWGSIDTVNSVLPGFVRNPYNTAYASGGSSGGTGAAIAASFAVAGFGTDTGLSVRAPSSINCLVGLRPTHGLISCNGVVPMNADWDTVGPMARTVRDLAILLDVVAGYDPGDQYTVHARGNVPDSYTSALVGGALEGMRIGAFRHAFTPENADPEVIRLADQAILDMRAAGAEVVDPLDIPGLPENIQTRDWYKRFKHDLNGYLGALGPNAPVKTLEEIIESGKVHPFYMDVLKEHQDWPYDLENDPKLAEKHEIERSMRTGFMNVMNSLNLDAIIFPTFNYPPKKNGDRYTPVGSNNVYSSVTGFPALVVPMGFIEAGLPVGLQILGAPWNEKTLIRVGYGYEQAAGHRRAPQLTSMG